MRLVGNPVHVYSLLDRLVNRLPDITFADDILESEVNLGYVSY